MRRPRWRINLSRRAALGVSVLCVGLVLTAVTAVILTRSAATGPWKQFYAIRDETNQGQIILDQQFQEGKITSTEWRNGYRQNEQRIRDALPPGQNGAQDPLIAQYDAVRKPFEGPNGVLLDPQGAYDALDQWRASLPPADQKRLDNLLTPTGGTPFTRAYHTATRMISDSGYYKLADQTAAILSRGHFPTWNALTARYAQDAKARRIELASYPPYQEALSVKQEREMIFLARNPKIDALRSYWYGTAVHSPAAYREILQRTGVRPKLVTP